MSFESRSAAIDYARAEMLDFCKREFGWQFDGASPAALREIADELKAYGMFWTVINAYFYTDENKTRYWLDWRNPAHVSNVV